MQARPGPSLVGGDPLSGFDEEEVLARILPILPLAAGLVVAPGDDAAVVRTGPQTIATTDTVVLGRDWVDEWSSGADIGHKVIVQNLADVAAMGGRPTGVLLTLVADPDISMQWVLDHATGVAEACRSAGVGVLGGDLSSAPPGVVVVSVTALGDLEGPLVLRSGARPGDVVAVHGSLGLAAGGLLLLQAGTPERHRAAVQHQRRPQSPLLAGPEAAAAGASAMIDVSDGLLRDAARIARASDVVIDLEPAALASDVAGLEAVLGRDVALDCVLAGGEEHSLLATFPDGRMPQGWRPLGLVRAMRPAESPGVLVGGDVVRHTGWDHFRPER